MITLYGGRMILERRSLVAKWEVTIKIPLQEKRQFDLDTYDIKQAYIRAQYYYLALKKNITFAEAEQEESSQLKCWSCIHWLPRAGRCNFEFPEARQTNGRYAAKCEVYSDGTKDFGTLDEGC